MAPRHPRARRGLSPATAWAGAGTIGDRTVRLSSQSLQPRLWNGDYIDEVGRRDGWPEEYLRKNLETVEAQRAGFRRALAEGVKIAYGTDAGVYPHGMNGRQLATMVRLGMTPMAALQSATIEAARALGWEDRVGSIATGRYADLVAVPGEGLGDLTGFADVGFVMKGGAVVKHGAKP